MMERGSQGREVIGRKIGRFLRQQLVTDVGSLFPAARCVLGIIEC
jgi:hypothetical protein